MGVSAFQIVLLAAAAGLYLMFPISCAVVAKQKSRSALGWFVLGLIFPFTILLMSIAPDRSP